ncbi:MAG TPA: DinB family protein [Acidisarcina sp.]
MSTRQSDSTAQLGSRASRIFLAGDCLNQALIEHLDSHAWRAKPPGGVRTIAAIFSHMHNVRAKWVRLTAPHMIVPPQLHRLRCSPQQARTALAESAVLCAQMLEQALGDRCIETFRRDGWGAAWPAGVEMLCYMLSHEAHHRGQVCMLAHQLGSPLPIEVANELWNWDKLWKQCGFPAGPGR